MEKTRKSTFLTTMGVSLIILLTVAGCSNPFAKGEETVSESKNPNAEEILSSESNADIFQFDGIVYQTDIDWVDELSLTKDKQVGEIKSKNETDTDFENEMSNKLPVGAKIFSTKERNDILIVESKGKELKYLSIVEG